MLETFKKFKGKKITCGIIVMDENKSILAGHPTGRDYGEKCYDLLKGCADENEEDLEAALRELKEESSFTINDLSKITDLGLREYNKEKYIHLFLYKVKKLPKLKTLSCKSYFMDSRGNLKPEMNGYRIIKKNERNLFYEGLQNVLKNIKEIN